MVAAYNSIFQMFFGTETLHHKPPSEGGIAQLVERLLCKQDVIGSIPVTSTIVAALGGIGDEWLLIRDKETGFAG